MTNLRQHVLSFYIARMIQLALNRPPRRYWYWRDKERIWFTEDGVNLSSSGAQATIIELTALEYAQLKLQTKGPAALPDEMQEQAKGEIETFNDKTEDATPTTEWNGGAMPLNVSDEEMQKRLPGWNK